MPVPNSLALTVIPDGSNMTAAPVRNNYNEIQAAVNDLIDFFRNAADGSLLRYDGTQWVATTDVTIDDANHVVAAPGSLFVHAADCIRMLASGQIQLLKQDGGGSLDLFEQSASPVASAGAARLFAVDNGAGKTVLKVIFGTGAAQTVATQP